MTNKTRKLISKKTIAYCLSGITLCVFGLVLFRIGRDDCNKSYLEVIGIIINTLGAMLIVYQLLDSKDITCCNMLAEMNFRFVNDKNILRLYERLEKQYRIGINSDSTEVVNFDDISLSDVMSYCSFFEVMYEYVEHNVITIKQMDDLFGYRFFIFVHNKYIQEHELFAVPSSYANIYRLYAKWLKYRQNHSVKAGLVVENANEIPTEYFTKELYLEERIYQDYGEVRMEIVVDGTKQDVVVKRLSLDDYSKVVDLLNKISETRKECIVIDKQDYQESVLVDYAYGIFHKEELIAVCICVLNRKTKRNAGYRLGSTNYKRCITVEVLEWDSKYSDAGLKAIFDYYLTRIQTKLRIEVVCYRTK